MTNSQHSPARNPLKTLACSWWRVVEGREPSDRAAACRLRAATVDEASDQCTASDMKKARRIGGLEVEQRRCQLSAVASGR